MLTAWNILPQTSTRVTLTSFKSFPKSNYILATIDFVCQPFEISSSPHLALPIAFTLLCSFFVPSHFTSSNKSCNLFVTSVVHFLSPSHPQLEGRPHKITNLCFAPVGLAQVPHRGLNTNQLFCESGLKGMNVHSRGHSGQPHSKSHGSAWLFLGCVRYHSQPPGHSVLQPPWTAC